jgi:RNA polymerase sigma factor (TIGR02999 family)
LPEVYAELRRLAAARLVNERPGQTLQATALVHEAWLRVSGAGGRPWASRGHFFAAAAEAIRRILIERARRRQRIRHGGGWRREDALDAIEVASPVAEDRLLRLSEALDELAQAWPRKATVVKLRYFVGLSDAEIAEAVEVSVATVERDWAFARAWLFDRVRDRG